jgi:hypothetical protein
MAYLRTWVHIMIQIIKLYLKLCIFREKPEHSPHSPLLLWLSLFASLFLSYFVTIRQDLYAPLFNLLLISPIIRIIYGIFLVSPIITPLYTYCLFKMFGLKNRLVQVQTCIFVNFCIIFIVLCLVCHLYQWILLTSLNEDQGSLSYFIFTRAAPMVLTGFIWVVSGLFFIYKNGLGTSINNALLVLAGLLTIEVIVSVSLPTLAYYMLH